MNDNLGIVYNFKETPFEKLMQKRISDILLICSQYDKFMLDEDGRIDEQLFQEYVSLNLRRPPRFTHVLNEEEAFLKLKNSKYDLVISMLNYKGALVFDFADKVKEAYPDIPVVVLSPFSKNIYSQMEALETTKADYIFSWLGNTRLLLAIVKLIEDKINVKDDVETGNVQVIILVENSVRYYSSYLPNIYMLLYKQATRIMEEGLNQYEKNMRMRGRPKILLATTLEEAVTLYNQYKQNILGIISDIGYKTNLKDKEEDPEAGLKLCKIIREDNHDVPILLQSAQIELEKEAKKLNASFICKDSETLLKDLRTYIIESYGFGDFVFHKDNVQFDKASNLKELQEKLEAITCETIATHIRENRFSKWLRARALFSLADIFKPIQLSDFQDSLEETKKELVNIIKLYRKFTGRGSIASFDDNKFDDFVYFSRIGDGSLGGKGRGLAFINSVLKNKDLIFKYKGINITIPRTIVISTSVFEDFMEQNNLYSIAYSSDADDIILKSFLEATLPEYLRENIKAFLNIIKVPVAVRSSSLLEDSLYQPFAGIYATYMLPNNSNDFSERCIQMEQAIKCVYASTYSKKSKAYISVTKNVIDEEKMAVVIQELTGKQNENYFHPDFSGVAKSYNYYPITGEKTEDGIVEVSVGLGKIVVGGGNSVRFSPPYPEKILQFYSIESTMQTRQKKFYALDLSPHSFTPSIDEESSTPLLDIKEAEKIDSFKYMTSIYDMENQTITDDIYARGPKIVTFAGILKYNAFPLAEILQTLLGTGKDLMNCPIEIEFAVNLSASPARPHVFSFLQVRPIVEGEEAADLHIDNYEKEDLIIQSRKALGNGKYKDISDFVYIKPESFDPSQTIKIAAALEEINTRLVSKNLNYILLVPGRLGSSDPWLGVPVSWPQISSARVIIETGLKNFQVEPSQGSHFFHNITSLGIAYFTINPTHNDGYCDFSYLASLPAEHEDEVIKHIKFENHILVVADGKKREGIIVKPQAHLACDKMVN
ncbi:MAG: phosphoenolpyruvate synthase [Spirochaetaceae bacterium]|nr:phosphoenolpyruvate synthase [Spirochaetaceae bacterium]